MKIRATYCLYLFLTLVFVGFGQNIYSQGTGLDYNSRRTYIGISGLPAQTSIRNNGIYNAELIHSTNGYTINGSLELGYFISDFFSISGGIGYRSYSSELSLANYFDSYQSVDSESDPYEMQVSGAGIIENQTIGYLNLPFKLTYRVRVHDKMFLFAAGGVSFNATMNGKYHGSGTFDYDGYYPDYNVTLFDLPEYGFHQNIDVNAIDDLNISTFTFNAFGGLGMMFYLGRRLDLNLGVIYDLSLLEIYQDSNESFFLSRNPDHYSSLMNSSTGVDLSSFGINVAVFYYLR